MKTYFKTDKNHFFMRRDRDTLQVSDKGLLFHPSDHHEDHAIEISRLEFLRELNKLLDDKRIHNLVDMFKSLQNFMPKSMDLIDDVKRPEPVPDSIVDVTTDSYYQQFRDSVNDAVLTVNNDLLPFIFIKRLRKKLKGLNELHMIRNNSLTVVRFKERKYTRHDVMRAIAEILEEEK